MLDKLTSWLLLSMTWFLVPGCANSTIETVPIKSPDGKYELVLANTSTDPTYTIYHEGNEIISPSKLGIQLSGSSAGNKDYHIDHVETNFIDRRWKPVYGERSEYPDIYNEALVVFGGNDANFNIRVRAYDEGVAFRYEFHNNIEELVIEGELTEFSIPPHASVWAAGKAQAQISKMPVSEMTESVERPLLVQLPNSYFVAIGEAGLVDHARMKLVSHTGKAGTLIADLASEVKGQTPFNTPWRYIMASTRPGDLLENNYLLLNLNEPCKIEDTSWIKPGKVIREVTLTTRGGMACVDFAARHNLQYIEFDAGWYGNEYDDSSDATTVTVDPKRSKGPLDLHEVISYADSKGIGVTLYVNRRALEKQLDQVLPLYESWGVKGVKYGFVNVGSQYWTSWLHSAVRKAADHHLMVDIHDEYRPTGYSRTYPNLLTQEGIRGDEESPDNAMVLKTLFTRMIAGAGDHTNCYFARRVLEKMGSHASQLAKAVCIYSPWQFLYWYDRPAGASPTAGGAGNNQKFIQEVPELAFYDALPTVWDDTKVLAGHPGELAVIARRSGDHWFVGALSGHTDQKITISLDFLDADKEYEARLYSDQMNSPPPTYVSIQTQSVSANDQIDHQLQKNQGLAIHLKPVN